VTVAGAGGRSISPPRVASSRPTPRALSASSSRWWSRRSRGRVTTPGFTRSFEDSAAWLAVNTSKSAICLLMRIAWRTVGRVCERVAAEAKQRRDLFAGLKRLGFDEISIRKGHRYLTVVVDHHTGRLVWAHGGRDRKTVEKFQALRA
jgi:transposase